jgi:hypothetical protein
MQVPENMAAEPQTAAASSNGHMGDAVIEARRALRSVQDVKHSVAESTQVTACTPAHSPSVWPVPEWCSGKLVSLGHASRYTTCCWPSSHVAHVFSS